MTSSAILHSIQQILLTLKYHVTQTAELNQWGCALSLICTAAVATAVSTGNCDLLGCYSATSANSLPTFRDILKMWPIGLSEASVRNYHRSLHNNPQDHSSQPLRDRRVKTCCSHQSTCSVAVSKKLSIYIYKFSQFSFPQLRRAY